MNSPYSINILDEARVFANEEIRPYATKFDLEEGISLELIKKIGSKGLLGATFPSKYGGLELNPIEYGCLTEEFGKACSSTRALLTVNTSLIGESILRWGNESQKIKWLSAIASGNKIGAFALTEPETGSDARNICTSYKKDRSKYIINGKKKWITFSLIADFFLVIATNGNDISAFIVDRNISGIIIKPLKGLLASRGAYVGEIEFINVEVDKENLLGKEGDGFTYIVNSALDHGRYSIAWAGLALAQEALNKMVTYSRNRSQFGKKIYNFQLIQGLIADATTNVHAARSLCINAGRLRMEKHNDALIETTIAKYFTSKVAMQITMDAVQVHGGNGCDSIYTVERLFREAKVLEIIEGSSQIQQEIISRYGLRRYFSN